MLGKVIDKSEPAKPSEVAEQPDADEALPAPNKLRQLFSISGTWLYPFITLIVILIIWAAATRLFDIPTYLVPSPAETVSAFLAEPGQLLSATAVTAYEAALGFALSLIVGIPLAVGIAGSRLFSASVYPLLAGSNAIPKVAIAPLFIVWFGFGLTPKVMLAFLVAFFPIVVSTTTGLRSVEVEQLYLARTMGMSHLAKFMKIRLPSALPSLFSGLRIASTLAVIGAIVGEFVGADSGIGYRILIANGNLNTPALFAGLALLTCLGLAFFGVVVMAEKLFVPWRPADGSTPKS